ncbi:RNA-guided endonuclease InsQ/TnpB family protein [Kibdelosporangium phytohabitans]|uniref:RNA-guided endonuclease InsQ/TnpB family protein n=1 Tax=Kibdelosporangium phytohabitans TaxID=860235 RepID=UPI000ADB84CC|nr:transposase [Kibdelosporangium phytohabitans]MBE1463165.1 putative transposase [Kibdelosporangium phytohabitans]
MAEVVKRAFEYRFYPTPEQSAEFARTFGCARLVCNMALQARVEAWTLRQERVSYNTTSALLTGWRKTEELAFLNEVSSVPLQQALRHLQAAFTNFWGKRARYPVFKSKKRSRRSAEYTASAIRWRDGTLTLAKMGQPLAIVWSQPLPEGASPSTVTVSQDAAGRWFVSLLCGDVIEQAPASGAIGVDAGLGSPMILSTGEKIANPRHERADRARPARAQRSLATKVKGAANRAKACRKVARVYARITDRRRDYLHKLTTRLVRENQTIVIEDLTVRNMVKNHSPARAISDAAWREFRSLLECKAEWHGRDLVVVDRWFPSSQLCSACGARVERMPLNVRSWTCHCGATHDRDVNAARNILAAGLAVTACGDGVRPQRGNLRSGQSTVKQENPRATKGTPALQGREDVKMPPGRRRRFRGTRRTAAPRSAGCPCPARPSSACG